MKCVFLSMLLALGFLIPLKASGVDWCPSEGPKFTVTIELGSKPNCNYTKFSVCRIDFGGNGMTGTIQTFPAGSGSGGGGGGSWILTIPRASLAKYYPQSLGSLDGKNTVTFEETFIISEEIKNALGSTSDLMVKAKTAYPLKYENGEFTITLPL